MFVHKIVDQDVADKVDTQYIAALFPDVEDTSILYICTSEGGEEDEWIDESGVRHVVIHLPYLEVRETEDIRPMMLDLAKKRLG